MSYGSSSAPELLEAPELPSPLDAPGPLGPSGSASVIETVLPSASTAVTLASRSHTPVPANISLNGQGLSSCPTASWCILTRSTKSGSALTRVMATSSRRSRLARRPAAIAPAYPAPMTTMRCCPCPCAFPCCMACAPVSRGFAP